MSETAQTLIESALRAINVIASGETPTADELQDGLEALQIMLRSWSSDLDVYLMSQDTLAMTGASSYTIGSGGDCDTTRPEEIRGAVVDDIYELTPIGPARYRSLATLDSGAVASYFWYDPEYPLGVIYPYPTGGTSMVIDSIKQMTEPSALTTEVQFPPHYDAAIKFNLAIELAPEFGKEPSMLVFKRAEETKRELEAKNLAAKMNASNLANLGRSRSRYNINYDS